MPVEGEVPEAGDEDAHGDEADAEGEEDGGEGLPQHHHGQHEVDEGRAALDGAVHRDVHPVQRDQGQSTAGEKRSYFDAIKGTSMYCSLSCVLIQKSFTISLSSANDQSKTSL